MSAIAGLYYRHGQPAAPAGLGRMLAILAHRGPDGARYWCDGPAGLGHAMLWTTPESLQETLPLVSRDGRLVITADARIDNRAELIAMLDLRDRPPSRIADSELILAAYERWGEHCPAYLLGDFAFAIWDQRQQTLFCARDHMGVRPLVYCCGKHTFALASEIKALLTLPGVPRQIDEQRLADLLTGISDDVSATLYQGVFRLPPAHSLTVSAGRMAIRRYWSLDPEREVRLASDAAYAEAFRDIFLEAVHCRMRSAFPIGSCLSGGLDSSSIACVARNALAAQGGGPLPTFSAIFPGLPAAELGWIDERCFMDLILATGGFAPHMIQADAVSPLVDLDTMLWHQDEAFFGPNLYIPWVVSQSARRSGVRVVLEGVDGDTTVSYGWEYLIELARQGRWVRLAREAVRTARRRGYPAHYFLWNFGFLPLIPDPIVHLWSRRSADLAQEWLVGATINPEFARRTRLSERIRAMRAAERPARTAREYHWQSLQSRLLPKVLDLMDGTAAAFGVESRFPFFDRRMIEFCLAVPASQKLSNGLDRAILRRAMAGIIPPQLQRRVIKADLGFSFRRRLLEFERPRLDDVIVHHPDAIAPYFDPPALGQAYQRYLAWSIRGEQDIFAVYMAAVCDRWLRAMRVGHPAHRPDDQDVLPGEQSIVFQKRNLSGEDLALFAHPPPSKGRQNHDREDSLLTRTGAS